MTRRECGTCRFFEQSGIGESGYCRNQRCQGIVGIALVRRQELACRLGWNDDYYEPIAARDALPGQYRPAPDPARQRTGYQGTRPDDIIVGVEQPQPTATPPVMQPPRPRVSNVGEAHRRALERRQVAQQSGDTLPTRRLTGVLPPPEQAVPTGDTNGTAERPRALTGDEGVSRPRIASSPPDSAPRDDDRAAHLTTTMNLSVAPDASAAPETTRPQWNPPPGMQTAPAPYDPQRTTAARGPESPPPPYRGDHVAAPYAPGSPQNGAQQTPIEMEWYQAERQRHRGKRCANCRDFQVAESGDRGWCRNRFAFPTPQLVGPNDLACLNCIGTWWAANDQWWLAKAPAPPAVATPLADALLEEMQDDERRQSVLRRPGAG